MKPKAARSKRSSPLGSLALLAHMASAEYFGNTSETRGSWKLTNTSEYSVCDHQNSLIFVYKKLNLSPKSSLLNFVTIYHDRGQYIERK